MDSQIPTEFPGFCGGGGGGVVVSLRDLLLPDPFTGSSEPGGRHSLTPPPPSFAGPLHPVINCCVDLQD